MPALMFAEWPLDPLRIERHRLSAGLAFEKHRWCFPTREEPASCRSVFTFGSEPLREIYKFGWSQGEPVDPTPLADHLAEDAIPAPALQFTLAFQTPAGPPRFVEALLAEWSTPISLVFSRAMLPPFEPPPRHTDQLIERIIGEQWSKGDRPGFVTLANTDTRTRALQALGLKGFHRLYLVAGPSSLGELPPDAAALFERADGLTSADEPSVEYRAFHQLVSACDWVLSSHGRVPGAVPLCFYSLEDMRPLLRARAVADEAIVEPATMDELNHAVGVQLDQPIGLKASDIMPWELLTEQTELSFVWSDLGQLEELADLRRARHLNLDGTVVEHLRPLANMPWLESLSVRFVQLTDIEPLVSIPSLRQLALSRRPRRGLSPLAAMPSLRELDLTELPIEDLSPIGACPNLAQLSLNRTRLRRLDGIAQLRSLRMLSITSTPIRTLDLLTELPGLRELVADECHLDDLAPVPRIAGLESLSLSGLQEQPLELPDLVPIAATEGLLRLYLQNTTFRELPDGPVRHTLETLDISASAALDISWLVGLEALRDLRIAGLRQVDLEVLAGFPSLHVLDASECDVRDLAWLRKLTRLHTLRLNLTQASDLSPISDLRNLRSLGLAGVVVTSPSLRADASSLDILSGLATLEELDLRGWRLREASWLPELTQLRTLLLARTDFTDANALRNAGLLIELDLSSTAATALDGLEAARDLRRVKLDNTGIRDLGPIRHAASLEELRLRNTPVTDLSVVGGFKALRKLDLRGGPTFDRDLSPLLDLPRLELLLLDTHGLDADLAPALQRRHRVVFTST